MATEVAMDKRGKREGNISHAFTSFSGKKSNPLPDRYRILKQNLTKGREEAIQKSWDDLIEHLKERTDEVASKREKIIPVIRFSDIANGTVPESVIADVRRTGVAVVRGVMDRSKTEKLLADCREYLEGNPHSGFPTDAKKKVVYETYWSPSQIKARTDPNMLRTQAFMNQMFKAAPGQKVDLSIPLAYCDRIQIRPPGDKHFALTPHVDAGSVERWEDKAYNSVYRKIFEGKWREFDPWDLTGRIEAVMDMYNGAGGSSVFRTFQGWLGLSEHGPHQGTLVTHPILGPSTAYWLLRPFFQPTRASSLDGWKFSPEEPNGDTILHGANPGTAQEHTPGYHPHLRLEETMIPYPVVEPGDTVFWSTDTIHGTENDNLGPNDACVFYIPSTPLTEGNIKYISRQRDALRAGTPPPDFPGGSGEYAFRGRGSVKDIASEEGRLALGFKPFPVKGNDVQVALAQRANEILGFQSY
ncbi:hypothetical protein I302_106404 [Kwoniella bestiolae CBS 10118]|uniref:DUF1479-domain-containing protein n=1 Tax=Kwoniella bestiolae CBS 10118 TaxID=1296100 RepID=A0A1B9G1H8_9TREE|nr:hypothetical protein I302_06338 [Kwoniella bestiolae CBS 10118]OCF24877.1 hypothetical protein I302_06338 [Kwoniella bestiolae CBS 10118]